MVSREMEVKACEMERRKKMGDRRKEIDVRRRRDHFKCLYGEEGHSDDRMGEITH